jgi:REP element-mobilizing transposase RayT
MDAAMFVARGISQTEAEAEAAALANRKLDRYLDRGTGSCPLKNPKVAELVGNAIEHFDGDRYWLFDWSLMPNHVHVVFEAVDRLNAIVHSWKSFTGLRANEALGRKGFFWQKEPWDRLIRDDADLIRTVRYVASNPERAGLRDWTWTKVYEERLPAVSVI